MSSCLIQLQAESAATHGATGSGTESPASLAQQSRASKEREEREREGEREEEEAREGEGESRRRRARGGRRRRRRLLPLSLADLMSCVGCCSAAGAACVAAVDGLPVGRANDSSAAVSRLRRRASVGSNG